MRRRELMCGAAVGNMGAARAQGRVPHIVFLWFGAAGSAGETLKGFQAGLRNFGYQEGRNIAIDYRYADGNEKRLAELAAAAVAARPDLISAFGIATSIAAKLTRTIPIVSLGGDLVEQGFAASLAHPRQRHRDGRPGRPRTRRQMA
jgi:putative tryptophan/tyrosine transport system substrate-binding protein